MRYLILLLVGLMGGAGPIRAEQVFRNGDQFEMRLSGPPEEFTREFNLVLTVDNDSVNLPIIGRVRAAGLSSTQLAQFIEKRLKDDRIFTIANINITVNANQYIRTIIVGGSVRAPGRQPWVADLTLTGAISTAGGPSEWASDGIKVIRDGRAQRYSRKAIKRDPSIDPKVQPGDVIELEGDF